MSDKLNKYIAKKRLMTTDLVRNARRHTFCYLFLLPYAILFITFYVLPMLTSIYFSFTNYNILEKPDFIGVRNYINLFLEDEVFTIAVKNTFVIALIIGPVGYIMAFLFAWLINELPNWLRKRTGKELVIETLMLSLFTGILFSSQSSSLQILRTFLR